MPTKGSKKPRPPVKKPGPPPPGGKKQSPSGKKEPGQPPSGKKEPGQPPELPADAMDAAIDIGAHIASALPTHRQCSIQITNKCSGYILSDPSVHINSGCCADALSPTVEGDPVHALFSKTADTARGAVGVFTYDVLNKSTKESTKKIAVMFSVPYDYNLYSNWYAVGIFDKNTECDDKLFQHMYNNTEDTFSRKKGGCGITHKKDQLTISAMMSNSNQPDMKVEVCEG